MGLSDVRSALCCSSPGHSSPGHSCLGLLVLAGFFGLVACGGAQVNPENAKRSASELELAAELRREGNVPGAVAHAKRAIELNERNSGAHLLLGHIHYLNGDLEGAITRTRDAVAILEKDLPESPELAEARNMLGTVYMAKEDFQTAVSVLEKSAFDIMNRTPHLALGNLGLAYHRLGKREKALEVLRASVAKQPRFCVGYLRMGEIFVEQGDFENAEKALSRSLDADETCGKSPLMQRAWRLRGETRSQLGGEPGTGVVAAEAVADLQQCVTLGPDSADGQACVRFLRAAGIEVEKDARAKSGRPDSDDQPDDFDGFESDDEDF